MQENIKALMDAVDDVLRLHSREVKAQYGDLIDWRADVDISLNNLHRLQHNVLYPIKPPKKE